MLPVLLALVQPVQAAETFAGQTYYLGDLHAHSGASGDGGSSDFGTCMGECGAFADFVAEAKSNGLDFMAFTDHTNGAKAATDEDYQTVLDAIRDAHDPEGGFVTLVGAEVHFTLRGGSKLGHKNLILFGENDQLASFDISRARPDPTSTNTALTGCADTWAWMSALEADFGPAILIPHHPALTQPMPVDWSCHDPYWEPIVEVYSEHGNSMGDGGSYDPPWSAEATDGTIHTALHTSSWGHRFGFIGSTDAHETRPGRVCGMDPQHPQHPYGGGLMIAVLPEGEEFDRSGLYDAITDRKTYATSGPFIPVAMSLASGRAPLGSFGDAIGLPSGQPLEVEVSIPEQWVTAVLAVDLVSENGTIRMEEPGKGVFTVVIDGDTVPPWLYARVEVDGNAIYEGACDDGGDELEYIWLSPVWVEEADPDLDGDAWSWLDGDCHDADASVHPGATEVCEGEVDEDCDGLVDQDDEDCVIRLPGGEVSETPADPYTIEGDLAGGPRGSGVGTPPRLDERNERGGCTTAALPISGSPWLLGPLALLRRRRGR